MKILLTTITLLLSSGVVSSKDYLPTSVNLGETAFERCDQYTLRYGLVIKVAQIGWYARNCKTAQSILDVGDKVLRFHYFKNVKADFFKKSAEEFFLKNLAPNQKQPDLIQALKSFNNGYTAIKEGEYFELIHSDDKQLKLYRNDRLLASSNNEILAKNYFNIWFGKEPVIDKLKKAFN